MRFGTTLQRAVYPPWKTNYINYKKLKQLLREADNDDEESPAPGSSSNSKSGVAEDPWTDRDEEVFTEQLTAELSKVNNFQAKVFEDMQKRTGECEKQLESTKPGSKISEDERKRILASVGEQLDKVSEEIAELEKFSRINFTGFHKIAKKHDRKRGTQHRIRPYLQTKLGQAPFNKEDYSPFLYRLSQAYQFVREGLGQEAAKARPVSMVLEGPRDAYQSHIYWVHKDNLTEVKAFILRHLPLLVYNPQSEATSKAGQNEPTISSTYFDNDSLELYRNKLDFGKSATSLRLRWTGNLKDKPDIYFELKTTTDGRESKTVRFPIKEKYIQPFLKGEYKMEKTIDKLDNKHGEGSDEAKQLKENVDQIYSFIKENNLQQVVRANYRRTAFQIPGNDSIRISIDTDLALIREDRLDPDHLCREEDSWHRRDIDENGMKYPFKKIKNGEISRFPHAILDIKVKTQSNKMKEWVSELMSSHLVKEAPRFSKFVHGVAVLFEDRVNGLPFWFNDLETDIRRDPNSAFEEEQDKYAKRAADEMIVGSYSGVKASPFKRAELSAAGQSPEARGMGPFSGPSQPKRLSDMIKKQPELPPTNEETDDSTSDDNDNAEETDPLLASIAANAAGGNTIDPLSRPPKTMLDRITRTPGRISRFLNKTFVPKPAGDISKIDMKVWLANQRTFIKWQHIAVLLATLSLGLFNAAGVDNRVARTLGIVYTAIAAFASIWGYGIYVWRDRLIKARSGKDFDNIVGPLIVCVALLVALLLNFAFKYDAVIHGRDPGHTGPPKDKFGKGRKGNHGSGHVIGAGEALGVTEMIVEAVAEEVVEGLVNATAKAVIAAATGRAEGIVVQG